VPGLGLTWEQKTPHIYLENIMKDDETVELTVEYLVTKGEFNNPNDFSLYIEKEAKRKNIGCLEALIEYCEKKDIDPISVAKSLTSSLKQKIQAEAEDLNLLKTKSGKLPS